MGKGQVVPVDIGYAADHRQTIGRHRLEPDAQPLDRQLRVTGQHGGGLPDGGGCFTKDACYSRGIVLNHAFMLAAIQHDRPELIPFLFAGKVAHEDVPILQAHVSAGIVKPPPYLPPIFHDMNGLAIWLCFSTFFSTLCKSSIVEHYAASMTR